ncbi:energy-coupling factor transport system substrate-specific component [Pedococcus dokdonensis]|uniref:Energy-coupling factor transport system substrate-specific component n=1 Tax=Pedococcus dokdonensis TaxID=443156 RepID=A0A1H0T7X6_9MICO|nr:ECF transporter S component [Pedococcus dokdonensis]SDP50114.1 energy-coupling factor transport system substrate-specific component [Pedococcus dokdonensis]
MSTTNTPAGSAETTTPTTPADPAASAGVPSAPARRGSIRATAPLFGWRTVDLLTVTFLAVAFGVAYWGYDAFYNSPFVSGLSFGFQPLWGLFAGPWFLAGVVGGLVIRRPGAALFCEFVAALVAMLIGNTYGASGLLSGLLQGLGAEAAFLVFGYGAFGLGAAVFAGALAAPLEAVYEWFTWTKDWSFGWKLAYGAIMVVSGAVVAGAGGWALTKALARAGGLGAFPAGQEVRERGAV